MRIIGFYSQDNIHYQYKYPISRNRMSIMCLYSQDNIQTLATHSPSFVWEEKEAGTEKEIRGFLMPDWKAEGKKHLEMKTNIKWGVSANFGSFVRWLNYHSLPTFPSTHESVILSKGKNGSQIDSYKPEIYTLGKNYISNNKATRLGILKINATVGKLSKSAEAFTEEW